jgi:hypothetical protein
MAAPVVAGLGNGVALFGDGGKLLPKGRVVFPARPALARVVAMAARGGGGETKLNGKKRAGPGKQGLRAKAAHAAAAGICRRAGISRTGIPMS